MQFVVFSKHLQDYSVEKALQAAKQIGLDGLDLTCRPGGHVVPENVEKDLPRAMAAARGMGLDIPMLTTSITSRESPGAEATFATAAKLGIKLLKLGYWTYKEFGEFRPAVRQARKDLEGIEPLARKHGVCACVHIHSGRFVSANAAVVDRLIEGLDPAAIGAFPDVGHMLVEGGFDVWRQGLEMLLDRAKMVALKSIKSDLTFQAGRPTFDRTVVPLEEGPVDCKLAFELLREGGFDGVVSLHSEYAGLPSDQVVEITRKDWAYLKRIGVA